MRHIISKFGGTSVSTRATWNNIASITKKHVACGLQPVIVCSALTQISNKLEKTIDAALLNEHQSIFAEIRQEHVHLAEQLEVNPLLIDQELHQLKQWLTGITLLKQAPAKTHAQILSLGELMMTRLGHAFLEQQDIRCTWYDARALLTSTPFPDGETANYLSARCESEHDPQLVEHLISSGAQAIITQGFFAANPSGETVLLGRGGSDTSAALLAAKLQAASCEIWTDVPGIYTANPHQLPHARLLKQLNYDEAQEIATMGAKVLHPNCIPPVRRAKIPMSVKFTQMAEHSGTLITNDIDETAPLIKSIQIKNSIVLISIDALHMWQQVGFLSDVFSTFKHHGFSVDLLSSSEFNVTLSLDSNYTKIHDRPAINALLAELNEFGRAKLIEPCSAVSLVGHHIRTVLPQLGPVLEVFEAKQVYLMALASNDLNLTFVVDESQANQLCHKLHHVLIENNPQIFYYSKSWHEEFGKPTLRQTPWWEKDRERLLSLASVYSPCYIYHSQTQADRAKQLMALKSVDALFYAIKANPHPSILKTLEKEGIGFECVSVQELDRVLELFPDGDKKRILFTPNFASRTEYAYALDIGAHVTIDSLYPLEHWPDLFKNRNIMIRIDPGTGAGHHKHVSTGGNESKFGITQADLHQVVALTKKNDIRVVGLHAHSGSGILTPELWQQTASMLASLTEQFPHVTSINLGGGLGIVEKPGQQALDFANLDTLLLAVKSRYSLKIWLEPGRFFVAESGVLLAKVTQSKEKGKVKFIGIETGMNSLIRPSLYGSYHEIVNLSQLYAEKAGFAHIVGPICESGDTLGYDRLLPVTQEGDILLIANAGAYGRCMSSHYNLRPPAQELVLD